MNPTEPIVHRYIACWNETDAAQRLAQARELYDTDATYTDPLLDIAGPEGIADAIGMAQQQFNGLTFTLGSAIDAHHDVARFTWHLGAPNAEPIVVGFDVVTIDDNRIKNVYGFLDKVPATL